MTQETDTTSPPTRKARARLKRAYIRTEYPNHEDIISLTAHFGIAGKCASYDIQLKMSGAARAVIDKATFLYIAKQNEVDDPPAFLVFCLRKGIFIEEEGGYSNPFAIADQESYAETLERDRNRKGTPKDSPRIPPGNQKENTRTPDIDFDNEDESKNKEKGSTKIFEFVFMDEISIDQWKCKLGPDGFMRACEKLNGWIGESKADPLEFQKRKNKGKNASYVLQNWVAEAVSNEKPRGEKPQQPSRPRVPLAPEPPKREAPTAESKAKLSELLIAAGFKKKDAA